MNGTIHGPFDLGGPLPPGRIVLEASAGTGKTYTIAGLVTRLVAEGTELAAILVVTFTRPAAAELRDRVRARLVTALAHLDAKLAGGGVELDDAALTAVLDAEPGELARRQRRVATALADFDAATITTIHGFCSQVLTGLGLAVDDGDEAELVGDLSPLIEEVTDDVLVRRFVDEDEIDPPKRKDLVELATRVLGNPDAAVVPDPAAVSGSAAQRAALVTEIVAGVDARKRRRGQRSYDDLLTGLRDALADPHRGAAATAALRRRYRVALVDEFQDTDPVQWDLLARAFTDTGDERDQGERGPRRLVLIGDPKQAIYAFRGADVHAYLEAVADADHRATLATNWRSDAGLLAAYDTLFASASFGDPAIVYRSVNAAPGHDEPRLVGAGGTDRLVGAGSTDRLVGAGEPAPLQLRCLRRDLGLRGTRGDIAAPAARTHIVADLVTQTVDLLDGDQQLLDRDEHGTVTDRRELVPADLAVLARTNAEADQVQRALLDAGVPAIINGVGNVLLTAAATDWLRLLEALERPSDDGRVRAAALTAFVGWSAGRLAAAGEGEVRASGGDDDVRASGGDGDARASGEGDLDWLHERLGTWSEVLRDHGVASLQRTVDAATGMLPRVLDRPDGERFLTDLDHVGQLLHVAASADALGPSALAGWLRSRAAEASVETVPPEERARRLESDADAVQILTIHRSKGLEFPVVLCPFLSSPGMGWTPVPVWHEPETGQRTIDVGGKGWDGFDAHHDAAMAEKRGEDLRLLYVALTRARHRAIVWWAPVKDASLSSLGRVLFPRRRDGVPDTTGRGVVTNDDSCGERLELLADRAEGTIEIVRTPADLGPTRWDPPLRDADELAVARLERRVDRAWRRTSYSALTADAGTALVGGALVSSETDGAVTDDEFGGDLGSASRTRQGSGVDHATAAPTLEEAALRVIDLPLAGQPGGAAFGTLVHAVLEHVDLAADDLAGELAPVVASCSDRLPVAGVDQATLVDGLAAAIATPLGPLVEGRSLAEVGSGDRLDELEFELPLAGGDAGGRGSAAEAISVAAIGRLLVDHLGPNDPLVGYPATLSAAGFDAEVRGYLTGSIDLVLRHHGADGTPRFLIVDHKTNMLRPTGDDAGGEGELPSAWEYRPAALADAMIHGDYPLQALLYQVALHRFLRWRLPGYDPDTHLGGVLYLFLRGMSGRADARVGSHPCGVFSWQPPAALVVELSDLLHGGVPAAGGGRP